MCLVWIFFTGDTHNLAPFPTSFFFCLHQQTYLIFLSSASSFPLAASTRENYEPVLQEQPPGAVIQHFPLYTPCIISFFPPPANTYIVTFPLFFLSFLLRTQTALYLLLTLDSGVYVLHLYPGFLNNKDPNQLTPFSSILSSQQYYKIG